MATTRKGGAQDWKPAVGQVEVRYPADKKGVSKHVVKVAIKSAGNSRKKVEADLGERR
ncbi:DUF3606 domain-containing protein [Neorhizobium lilium]|uniref:DUF3606 domain-containing protein n=1 Tax=Neorhizobium lilium TaxID=2503024 RepID=A0A444LKW4_9HYPH|nr:DUF3606 domain-containing protein [Neorhizobium lilium]RWX80984.1 DUF3606 domain-containing protein [Neorhizobium lilium]